MKFVRLYSNRPKIFPPITFRLTGINMVIARVKRADNADLSSHNLGKTLLAHMLDFMLLKEVDKEFFLRKHADRFNGFIFFLEVLLPDSKSHVTIKRPCESDTKISLKKHVAVEGLAPFVDASEMDWDHSDVPLRRAIHLLDDYLAFDAVPKHWGYRKGVTYFLRTQHDYRDPFRVEKYQRARDLEWKPYVADLLGLPGKTIENKYKASQEAEGNEQGALQLEKATQFKEQDYDRVKAQIDTKEAEAEQRKQHLSTFDFHDAEMEISDDLVSRVESGIGRVEQALHYKRRDLQTAREGLANPLEFKADEVREIYQECKVLLPESLVRSYEQLEEFNRKLVKERNRYLARRIDVLEADIAKLSAEHQAFSTRRKEYLQVLKDKESMQRYKRLQVDAFRNEEELQRLKNQLERLGEISKLREDGKKARREADQLSDRIKRVIRSQPERYKAIRSRFREIVDDCLKAPAVLYVTQNTEGNIDFHAEIERYTGSGEITSEAEGSTYRKFLCVAFDLAILAQYSTSRFFHFVYHDGALEGSDDRKKLKLLATAEEFCFEYDLQYIFSAIQDEIPKMPGGKLMEIPPEWIIKELHDEGDSGRLFRMAQF